MDRYGPSEEPVLEAPAFDVLHDDEILFLRFGDFMDVADVGMIECRCRPGLAQEAFVGNWILLQLRRKKLKSNSSA
jgi:hypothetical protein